MITLTILGFFWLVNIATEPVDTTGCTVTEMGHLIRLGIPDHKIAEICKDVE